MRTLALLPMNSLLLDDGATPVQMVDSRCGRCPGSSPDAASPDALLAADGLPLLQELKGVTPEDPDLPPAPWGIISVKVCLSILADA